MESGLNYTNSPPVRLAIPLTAASSEGIARTDVDCLENKLTVAILIPMTESDDLIFGR
jgi:hypothetical protein